MPRIQRALIMKVLVACATTSGLLTARPAHATFYSVANTTADTIIDNGTCSFRKAMAAASTQRRVDACPAGTYDNEVNITGDPAHQLSLSFSDPIEVRNYTNISCDFGPGFYQQIIGNNTRFIVRSGGILDVQGIHFRKFNATPIQVDVGSRLDLQYVEISENTTPNAAWQTMGILNGGIANLYNVVIHHNDFAPKGGGVLNSGGALTIYNSSIYGNKVSQYGGAIHNSSGGTVYIANSTLSGNNANLQGGGIYNASGTVDIVWSTITANRSPTAGGLYNPGSGVVRIKQSIVSNNTGNSQQCAGTITSQGYNLLQACPSAAATGDVKGQSALLEPLVVPNGSQWSLAPWHTPSATSPAVDAIPGSTGYCAPDDQIYQRRSVGGKCDIGAIERQ